MTTVMFWGTHFCFEGCMQQELYTDSPSAFNCIYYVMQHSWKEFKEITFETT